MKMKLLASYIVLAFLVMGASLWLPKQFEAAGQVLLASVTIGLAVAAAVVFSFYFTSKIGRLVSVTRVISEGDLTKKSGVRSSDEIGELAESFDLMVENLIRLVGSVKQTSEEIFQSAQNLSATSQEMNASTEEIASNVVSISRGAETQAEMVTKASNLTKAFAQAVQKVADKSKTASDAAADVTKKAWEGGDAANQAIGEMSRIVEKIEKSSTLVEGFRSRALDINNAVEMITSVAQQTHLLALNATIEAARAGEHGRGFAVVAEEIRKLAENARSFASQISKLAESINTESEVVLGAMHQSTQAASSGSEVVSQVGRKLEDIVHSVMTTVKMIEEITALSREQTADASKMVESIDEISRIAEENASSTQQASAAGEELTASMDEMARAAQGLAHLSDRLKEAVSTFRVDAGSVAPFSAPARPAPAEDANATQRIEAIADRRRADKKEQAAS